MQGDAAMVDWGPFSWAHVRLLLPAESSAGVFEFTDNTGGEAAHGPCRATTKGRRVAVGSKRISSQTHGASWKARCCVMNADAELFFFLRG